VNFAFNGVTFTITLALRQHGTSTAVIGLVQAAVAVGGLLGFMPQDVGVSDGDQTVRALLLSLAPRSVRQAGESMLVLEAGLELGDPSAGMKLGEAIADWSTLGGYELEGQWDASCRRIIHASFAEVADRPARTLSGGERKQLVLDVLFASDAEVLLLDEPDNFLDVPAKLALERRVRASKKTIVMISHDREVLAGAVGTMSAAGALGPALQDRFAARLGLAAPDTTWTSARDRVAELVSLLALVTGTFARIGREVTSLALT